MPLNKTLLYSGPVSYISINSANPNIYYTLDGVNISFDTQWMDISVDQIPGTAIKKKLSHKIIVSFKVPELSGVLLKFAFAQPDESLVGTNLEISNNTRPTETLDIVIPTVSGRVRLFSFLRAFCLGATEIKFGNGEQTAWELKFECLYDISLLAYGDVTITA